MKGNSLRFTDLFALALRSFKTKPVRAVLTILGMSMGIGTVLFLVSLGYGLQYILIGKLITTEDSLITMEVSYPTETGLTISEEVIKKIKANPDVLEISPVAQFQGELSSASTTGFVVDTMLIQPSYFRLSGLMPAVGTDLKAGDVGAVLAPQALGPMGITTKELAIGKKFTMKVLYQDDATGMEEIAQSTQPVPIRGVLSDDQMAPTVIVLANTLSSNPPFYRKLLVKAKNIDVLEGVRDKLLSDGFIVSARVDLVNQAKKITNIITTVLGVFGITALVVSAIGMFNTMIVGFMERIYEVGILKSIGATDSDVRNLFLLESVIMGFLGGVGGVSIGYFGGQAFNTVLSIVATRMGGKAFTLFITPLWFIGLIIAISISIGLISGFWPAYRATKLSPKEAFTRK